MASDTPTAYFVVPAQAGTQRFQSLALGPRFRGGDGSGGIPNLTTAAFAGATRKTYDIMRNICSWALMVRGFDRVQWFGTDMGEA